jgi:hypothetical protein
MYHLRNSDQGHSNMLGRCPLSNQRICRAAPLVLEYCKVQGTEITLIIEFGPGIMQSAMDQVISRATAKVRRQIVVHGDRCLEESELPFQSSSGSLLLQARPNPDKCITWGVLDSVLDGMRQCGYEQGKYNLMRCIVNDGWSGEIGYVSLNLLILASGDKTPISHG